MKFARTLHPALLLLALTMVITSCTKREELKIAEFQSEFITVGEFENAYALVDPVFLPKATGFDGKKEFLTTMLNKEVMAYKADELGYDKDPGVVQGMEAFKKLGLQAGYLKKRVVDKISVSEEEVRQLYNNKGATLTIRQILCDTPEEADHVYGLLEEGADFQTVTREYSRSPDAESGGNILTVSFGGYAPSLQAAMFSLDVGSFTEPILTPYGYFIIKVLKREEAKRRDPYEENHATLEQEVRVYKEMDLTNEMTTQIRTDYGTEWFWEGIRICFDALPADRDFSNAPSRTDEIYPLLYFDDVDLEKPVVFYNNKTITVKDFSDFYDQASFFTRPRQDFRLGGIRLFLTERIMSELVVLEMARSGIEDDPEVQKVMRSKLEELMINRLFEDLINSQTVVTEQSLQDYYRNNLEAFKVPEKRRFGVILTGDFESAENAYSDIKDGAPFRTVAMAYSVDEGSRKAMAETDLLAKGEQPEVDRVGFAIERVGMVSEPFETSRGWMILKLVEQADERVFTANEARGSITQALKQELNDNRLNELLTKWKEELNVTIHEKNLRKVQIEERTTSEPTSRAAG